MLVLKGRIRYAKGDYSLPLGSYSLNSVFKALGFKTNYYNEDEYHEKNLAVELSAGLWFEFDNQNRWMSVHAISPDETTLRNACEWLAAFLTKEQFSFVLRCYEEQNEVYSAYMWNWNLTYELINQNSWDKA